MELIAGVHSAHEVFVAILDPADRTTELLREQRNEQVFGSVVLDPETAADVGRDAADESLGQSHELRDVPPQGVHGLTRRPDASVRRSGYPAQR